MERAELYSTLEVTERDETAAVLERDQNATALQLDASCLASEVCIYLLVVEKSDNGYRSPPEPRYSRFKKARFLELTSFSRNL